MKECAIEFMWWFSAKYLFFAIFRGRQKALENWENKIENVASPIIHVLPGAIHNHCFTMAVAVLRQNNVKLNSGDYC